MSVAELPRGRAAGLDRTPPQDVAAEQSVLGGMLLSKDAIADVVEVLRGPDFYRPAHELVFDAVLDLYGRGEPADAVTVAAELTRRGEIARVGGAPYLHTLISLVPTAANAGYYAQIVRERAVLRRLVEAGTRIAQMGYAADGGEVDDIVDRAQAEIYGVTESRTSEDCLPLAAVMEGTLDEIEAIGSRNGQLVGVPTGFIDLDELTNGLHGGQMVVIAARPGVGKALALDTPLPTPTGWVAMGAVQVGDLLLGADGRPTRVVAATGILQRRPCYELIFDDGSRIVADAEHEWATRRGKRSRTAAGIRIRTTAEIARALAGDHRRTPAVPTCAPLVLPARPLPLAPYVLGVCLGGRSTVADGPLWPDDPEVAFQLDEQLERGARRRVGALLRCLGVLEEPALPPAYLRAAESQRRALLAGLLDRAGGVTPNGDVELPLSDRRLAAQVAELAASLGYRCRLDPVRDDAVLRLTAWDEVFRVERKRLAHKERMARAVPPERTRRIVAAREVPSVPVRCVQVDATDALYLAGRAMIPTHNSTIALDFARSAAIRSQLATCLYSLEMSRNEITMRLLSAESRVPLHHMRTGKMTDEDWNRLARRMGEVSSAPLFIDDSPNLSMMEIRAKSRRLKQRHDLRMVIVDYLQLMTSGRRVESRQQEVAEFSRSLKLLAKELDVPVVALSQLNRGPEQRTDKRPQLADLRESGCLTGDTRVLRADTGVEASLAELYAAGARNVPVWSLDESLRYLPRPLTHVFPTGRRHVFRLRMASGRALRATANHPFLTCEGWRALAELTPGARLAVPRRVGAPPGEPGCRDAPGSSPVADAWARVRAILQAGTTSDGDELPEPPLSRIAAVLDDAGLDVQAVNDVAWDSVVAIEAAGLDDVFDATVLRGHNFIANGIAVHNSIEQDADIVMLLHREDLYERESPRAGEADVIVAKHRNGPTATVTVAFQGHYSRFVDMAPS